MAYEDLDDEERYEERYYPRPRGHSRCGIASFITSLIAGLMLFVLVCVAVVMGANREIDENDPETVVLGLGVMAGLGLAFVAFVLGIIGLFENRSKVFAVIGLVFSLCAALPTLGLLVIGLMVK